MTVFGLTLGELGVLLTFLTAIIGGFVRLQVASKQNARAAEKNARDVDDALRVARKVRDDMNGLRLEIAEKYASVEHLKEVEARLAVSIDRLTDRIDKLLSSLGK